MSQYPEELAKRDYYQEIIGSDIIEPPQINAIRYIGEDKPVVEHHRGDSEIEIIDKDGKLTFDERPF